MFIIYGRISLKGLRNNGFSFARTILNSAVFILNCWLNVWDKDLAKNWGLRKIYKICGGCTFTTVPRLCFENTTANISLRYLVISIISLAFS